MKVSSTSKKHRLVAASLATALACIGTAVVTAAPASARPYNCDPGSSGYSIVSPTTSWKATSLSSSYVRGPGVVHLYKGREWTVSASITATGTVEANAIFASASASLGITVGGSYSGSQMMEYELNVARGQVRRLQQYKQAKGFKVQKYSPRNVSTCARTIYWTKSVVAPVKSNADRYFLYQLVA
jgi:aryl-phospho-beta-D-glucosidase BglC (GH1 family)